MTDKKEEVSECKHKWKNISSKRQTVYQCEHCGIYTFEQPAQQQEPTVEDNSQNWRGMDGTTAYWLIQRHADGWADIGKMMGEWLSANQAHPEQEPDAPDIVVVDDSNSQTNTMSWAINLPLPIGTPLYTSPQVKPWVGLTDDEINACDPHEECWNLTDVARNIEAKLKEKNT